MGAVNGMFHFNAKETTASGRIGQKVLTVGCANERGDAGKLLEVLLVGFAYGE